MSKKEMIQKNMNMMKAAKPYSQTTAYNNPNYNLLQTDGRMHYRRLIADISGQYMLLQALSHAVKGKTNNPCQF